MTTCTPLDAVLADDEAPGRIACFLARLAAEKAPNAVLVDWSTRAFPSAVCVGIA